MRHLLDVNLLLAAIWENHPHHERAFRWLEGRQISVCRLAELGFLRLSRNYAVETQVVAQRIFAQGKE